MFLFFSGGGEGVKEGGASQESGINVDVVKAFCNLR